MFEVLNVQENQIKKSKILHKLNLEKSKYFVVSLHREENVDTFEKLEVIVNTLNSICESYNYKIIFRFIQEQK